MAGDRPAGAGRSLDRSRLQRLALVGLGLALVAAACGGSEDGSAPPPEQRTQSATVSESPDTASQAEPTAPSAVHEPPQPPPDTEPPTGGEETEPVGDDGWTNYGPLEAIEVPVPTSDNGWIALATKSELVEDFEIAAVSTDGAELVELPTNEASETSEADDLGARVSPDGRHVAFLSTREYEGDGSGSWDLYVMASDGSGERRLTSHGQVADLRWTPDGEWITYGVIDASGAATGEFRHMILAIRPDGTDDHERLQLTGFVAGYDWSPDGDRIAYAVCTVVQEPACDIWVANADGSDPEQVTQTGTDVGPSWSPSGEQLAFTSTRDENGACYFGDCSGFNGELYVMRSDGTGQRRLTHNPAIDSPASWSPDGSHLVFARLARTSGPGQDAYRSSVLTIDIATDIETVLVETDTGRLAGPQWATVPDKPAG